jgi:hypothetical protein
MWTTQYFLVAYIAKVKTMQQESVVVQVTQNIEHLAIQPM